MIRGLEDHEYADFLEMERQINDQKERNITRWAYYTAEQEFKNLGIAIDPEYEPFVTILGWCGKAIRSLANRIKFEGYVLADEAEHFSDLDERFDQTKFLSQFYQGLESMLVYGCHFMAFTRGDTSVGEPPVISWGFSALNATGLWDHRVPGRLRCGMTVNKRDKQGNPLVQILYYPGEYVTLTRRKYLADWEVKRTINGTGRVTLVPMLFRPTPDKPWGQSRITRAMMGIVDGGTRTNLRTEVNGEFYSYPQMVALNIKPDDFDLQSRIGKAMVIDYERDKQGRPIKDAPEAAIQQLMTGTQQPNIDQLRSAAMNFAAEADLSPDKLGVIHDNPSSADAIDRADAELNLAAEITTSRDLHPPMVDSLRLFDMVENQRSHWSETYDRVATDFRDPGMITRYSQKLAAAQLISAGALPPGEAITYEIAGMTPVQTRRLVAAYEKQRVREQQAQARMARSRQSEASPFVERALSERGEA